MTAPIDRLAELAGIEPIYFDAWGNRNVVSAESKRRLLAGMGFDVSSDEAVGRVAAEVEAKPWGRLAPPVVVATQGEVAVPLTVGAEAALDPVVWTVTLEDGGTRRGEADLAALAAEGEHRLPEGLRRRLRLPLPGDLPTGYHRLALELGGQRAELSLIVAPGTCFGTGDVPGLPNGRAWGLTCQLYSLRDGQDWGIGDFASLAAAAERAGALGANLLGVNPLHTLFYVAPEAKSPYFPSTRNFLNYLYIALPSVPEFAEAAETRAMMADDAFRSRLEAARAAAHVDYTAVAALKKPALEACYAAFRKANLGRKKTERGAAFRAFQAEMGAALRGLALYEALQEHLFGRDMQQFGWPQWPEAYRDPSSETVRKFEQDNLARVEYFEYLQFLADEQLAAACARGAKAGLKVGI
ncbi:MAG TPA: 4-alpha-glucanotransferase, partial [Alphaproteobacteria bacterium]|nr:4-alpha-glucanotransferase [Alphaproteobacteria bacterium]